MPAKLTKAQIEQRLKEVMPLWAKDPLLFLKDMWSLTPQPLKPEYETAADILIQQNKLQDFTHEFFQPFQRGLHITWQQWLIFLAITKAINGEAQKRISIASAHGIGKSCSISLTLLWYLFTHKLAQIACTAPTSKQLFDVLWKEISIWIGRLPSFWQPYFEWQSKYIRIKGYEDQWFAAAKTARKESTEALAGVHGEHVMVIADEASAVNNETFDTMEGSLTEKDILVILISNPTRLSGYFYETHNKPEISRKWQTLQFSNIDSPIVREDYNQDIIDKHGRNSDEYKIRVLGQFPDEDAVDDKGYSSLLQRSEIKEIDPPTPQGNNNNTTPTTPFVGTPIMGIDPAGEGRDTTIWVIRDQFKAQIVREQNISTGLKIAQVTRTLAHLYNVNPTNIWVDSFGVGANAAVEIAKSGWDINPINVGDQTLNEEDRTLYLNRKAQNYMRMRKALRSGFELIRHRKWKEDIPAIKFRRNERNKIQIMSKREMKKDYGKSPDAADALMLTFSDESNTTANIRTFTKNNRTNQNNNAPGIRTPNSNQDVHNQMHQEQQPSGTNILDKSTYNNARDPHSAI